MSTVGDNKKGFLKYVDSKWRTCDTSNLLSDEIGRLTHTDVDQVETLGAFFASAFNNDDGFQDPQRPELKDSNCSNDKVSSKSEFVQDLLLQLDAHKSMGPMGFIPGYGIQSTV